MKLLTFEIPDDLALLPEWLEGHVMGLHLPQVVTELSVLRGATQEPTVSLAEVLGDKKEDVLHTGLRSLARPQLRQLMKNPELLLELQRVVLDEGGEYWLTVPEGDEVVENTRNTWTKLKGAIAAEAPKSELLRPTSRRQTRFWASAGWLVATAAVVVAFFLRADLESRIAQQTVALDTMRKNLETQQTLAAQRIVPADLPETVEFVRTGDDPGDLPDDDPPDLPDIQ